MAADLTEEKSGFKTRAARSLRPASFDGKEIIAAILVSSGVLIFIITSYLNFFKAHTKNLIWKITETLTLALVTSSVYMETQEKILFSRLSYNL